MNFSSHRATTSLIALEGNRIRKERRPMPTPLQTSPKTVPPVWGFVFTNGKRRGRVGENASIFPRPKGKR